MKVVMPVAIPELLRFRERTGADRFDEMWQGVLHMTPSPSFQHQLQASRILNFLVEVWCPQTGGSAVMQVNVSTPERWDQDYRIPDVSAMGPERLPHAEAMFVRPSVVFEIRSPGDETYEKLPFYAAVGVEAVVVVERDTKATQVFARSGEGDFLLTAPGADGWTTVSPIGIELRTDSTGRGPVLRLRLSGAPETERLI
jgi:Uma2 family endonuclease